MSALTLYKPGNFIARRKLALHEPNDHDRPMCGKSIRLRYILVEGIPNCAQCKAKKNRSHNHRDKTASLDINQMQRDIWGYVKYRITGSKYGGIGVDAYLRSGLLIKTVAHPESKAKAIQWISSEIQRFNLIRGEDK